MSDGNVNKWEIEMINILFDKHYTERQITDAMIRKKKDYWRCFAQSLPKSIIGLLDAENEIYMQGAKSNKQPFSVTEGLIDIYEELSILLAASDGHISSYEYYSVESYIQHMRDYLDAKKRAVLDNQEKSSTPDQARRQGVMQKGEALALLGLQDDENLDKDQIKQAYRASMKMNHPDNFANNDELREYAEKQSRLINEAKEVLLSCY